MRKFVFAFTFLFVLLMPFFQQVINQTSAEAQIGSDGLYHLVLSGDATVINGACALGDCGRGFGSRIDALNYWTGLLSAYYHISIVPIPQPMAFSGHAAPMVLFSPFISVAEAEDNPSDFQWLVNCKEVVNGQTHIWVGYSSAEDLPDSYLSYLGNGPGITMDGFQAGEHDRAIDVITDYGDVTLILDPQEASITITGETVAPDCSDGPGAYGADGKVDLDDHGQPNNPAVNDRANACYSPGHAACKTDEDWVIGWKQIRGMA